MQVKLTLAKALSLAAALKALDGYPRVVKDGASEKIVIETYKFTPKFVWLLTNNAVELEDVADKVGRARNRFITELSGGKDFIDEDDQARTAKLASKMIEFTDQEAEFDLEPIAEHELNLEKNPIPPSVLAKLKPLMVAAPDKQ